MFKKIARIITFLNAPEVEPKTDELQSMSVLFTVYYLNNKTKLLPKCQYLKLMLKHCYPQQHMIFLLYHIKFHTITHIPTVST